MSNYTQIYFPDIKITISISCNRDHERSREALFYSDRPNMLPLICDMRFSAGNKQTRTQKLLRAFSSRQERKILFLKKFFLFFPPGLK